LSVNSQTYTNIEIIVVDDGSTDSTNSILKKLHSDCFISKIIYQKNAGVSSARNLGYLHSSGDFICFLDSDDILIKDCIKIKVDALLSDQDSGMVYGDVMEVDLNLRPTGIILKAKAGDKLADDLCNFKWPIPCPSNVLFRRDVLEKIGLFDEKLSTAADFDMWLRVCKSYKTTLVAPFTVLYRKHNSNMSNNIDLFKRDMLYIIQKHKYFGILNESEIKKINANTYYLSAKLNFFDKRYKNTLLDLIKCVKICVM
jgi:glycosyltransferase involved in cell wall biosynthesis